MFLRLLRRLSFLGKIIISSVFPVITILIFEIITGIHLFYLNGDLFFQFFGFFMMALSGLAILSFDTLVAKLVKA
jgi:hypothetical protein